MKGYIYKYTAPSGKSYIGQTIKKPKTRARLEGSGYSHSTAFYNAILKYGYINLKLEILYEVTSESTTELIAILNQLEVRSISKHNTIYPNGYNLNTGGDNKNNHPVTREKLRLLNTGKRHSLATRLKISQNNGRANLGKPRPKETCEKIRQTMTGRKYDALRRANISKATMGRVPWNTGIKMQVTPERSKTQSDRVRLSLHKRWHLNKDVVSPNCTLCSTS